MDVLFCSMLKRQHCPDVRKQMCTRERKRNNELSIPQHPTDRLPLKSSLRTGGKFRGGSSSQLSFAVAENFSAAARGESSSPQFVIQTGIMLMKPPRRAATRRRQRGSTRRVMIMRKQKLPCVTFIFGFSERGNKYAVTLDAASLQLLLTVGLCGTGAECQVASSTEFCLEFEPCVCVCVGVRV